MTTSTEDITAGLNPPQLEAVTHGDGPLLIFAGAGSGKTRVLTHRIAFVIRTGSAAPHEIMAVTFTNKAATEMKERIERLVGRAIRGMWVGTFHSVCARMLRDHGERIGIPDNYAIFDTDDQLVVIGDAMKDLEIDPSQLKPSTALNAISSAKNELMLPDEFAKEARSPQYKAIARIYARYQARLEENNALDFDDLIMRSVELLEARPEVLEEYQERFRYYFVDEYQDINRAQYRFVNLLARRDRNLCAVGDDDQSIYTWRGADMRLLLQFERDYPEAHVVKLEQNYRSPQSILDAAYHVISKNRMRKEKRLWTEREGGNRIKCYRANDEHGEAAFIARTIRELTSYEGARYCDIAVLYRVNAQSRVLEEMMLSQGIPYRVVGGLKFFARKEIKDIVAYLRVLHNPQDTISLRRIINTPTRGIGATTLAKLDGLAHERGLSLFQVVLAVEELDLLDGRSRKAVADFARMMSRFIELSRTATVTDLVRTVIEESGYEAMLQEEHTVQARTRLENVRELLSATREFEAQAEDDEGRSLRAFLEQVTLVTEIEESGDEEGGNAVTFMTLHAAKGLEFPIVFMAGMEEGVFPLVRSMTSGNSADLEEERRLCYVGITRTRQQLYCTMAESRTLYGSTNYNHASRFLEDIPEELVEGVEGSWSKRTPGRWTWEEADITTAPAARVILSAVSPQDGTGFRAGDRVRHNTFGEGLVLAISGSGDETKVTVNFPRLGTKTLVLAYAKLEKL